MPSQREYRVDELATAAGISVELLRSYQSKGLLPPPRHEGRIAFYGEHHLKRLEEIRTLKSRGYSLRLIANTLSEERARSGHSAQRLREAEESISLREVAERTGVPPAVLRSLEATGVLRPRHLGEERHYTEGDVQAVRMVLALVGDGVPMEEFLAVAKMQLDTSDQVADAAAALFMRYVREPLRAGGLAPKDEAARVVGSFRLMLHATTALMTYNFQRTVLNAVQDELERSGTDEEREALRAELARRPLEVLPT